MVSPALSNAAMPPLMAEDGLLQGGLILLVGLAGGLLPLLTKWDERKLHNALALSTGIFLGAVFLHMLPALSGATSDGHAHAGHGHADAMTLWAFVLVGVLAVYLLESLVFRTHDHDDLHRHRAVGYASMAGLSIHALTTGVGLAAASVAEVAAPVFLAIIAHKAFEAFSLMSVFELARFPRKRTLTLIGLFALCTPMGLWAGTLLFDTIGDAGLSIALALAAGTFLYVCLSELLPEVFHHKEDILIKISLLIVGIGLMAVIHELEG
ncbi:MAG: ZIP family metal transporter [Planctomycetota bacterium]